MEIISSIEIENRSISCIVLNEEKRQWYLYEEEGSMMIIGMIKIEKEDKFYVINEIYPPKIRIWKGLLKNLFDKMLKTTNFIFKNTYSYKDYTWNHFDIIYVFLYFCSYKKYFYWKS